MTDGRWILVVNSDGLYAPSWYDGPLPVAWPWFFVRETREEVQAEADRRNAAARERKK